MKTTMKAITKKYPEKGVWMEQVEVPKCGNNDILIKIKQTSICGTDVHIYNWDKWAEKTIKTPMIIGHEYVGEVVEVGCNTNRIKLGDIVTGEGHIVCNNCRHCLGGNMHLCKETYGVGVNRHGAFAEYLCIPETNAWKASDDIDQELFSIFDPLGNAVHTALSFDVIGEDVLITGAGPIGIMAGCIVKKNGARNVVITDINEYRLDLARKMGLTNAINTTKTSISEMQKTLGMKEGFDVGLEMSGNSFAFNDMIENMANGGNIAMLAIQQPETQVNWNKIVFGGLKIKGIYGREMYNTWYKMEAMIQSGLQISDIITHRFKVDDFQKGFDLMCSGNSGKIILNWED